MDKYVFVRVDDGVLVKRDQTSEGKIIRIIATRGVENGVDAAILEMPLEEATTLAQQLLTAVFGSKEAQLAAQEEHKNRYPWRCMTAADEKEVPW